MNKISWFLLFGACFLMLPLAVYAGGGKEVNLVIENRTGAVITDIIITETGKETPNRIKQEIPSSSSHTFQFPLKKQVLYDISLIDKTEREYLKVGLLLENNEIINFSRKDMIDVFITIENKTGVRITEIIITELNTENTTRYARNIDNNLSTIIMLRKEHLYGVVLIDANERQYAQERRAWEDDARITFSRNDIQDRNLWDKVLRVILWPAYL